MVDRVVLTAELGMKERGREGGKEGEKEEPPFRPGLLRENE